MPVTRTVESRKRIIDHGEVFTPPGLVNDMLNLPGVAHECERIDSRFLEPACGDGNFLAEVLRRKLLTVNKKHARNRDKWERDAILAVCSLYGIDLLEDNVIECRQRLCAIVEKQCNNLFSEEFLRTVRFVLERNIIHGNALSLKTVAKPPQPIVFSEWTPVNGSMVKRTDFEFEELLEHEARRTTAPLFSEMGEKVFFPHPVRDYPLTHYLKLADAEAER